MTSPLSLVISAFARVEDVRHTVTPQLSTEDNALLLIDLGKGHNALGATALAQVYRQLGDKPADVRDVAQLKGFWNAMQARWRSVNCWPTTTAPTAVCLSRWRKWPLPATAAWKRISPRWATTIWPRCSTKSWGGDSGPRRRP